MKIYIELKGEIIEGWATTRGKETDMEVEIAEDHPLLYSHPREFIYRDGEFIDNNLGILEEAKKSKDVELNEACRQAILCGFDHVIDGKTYHFSFDTEAQLNFQGSKSLLDSGMVESIDWTAICEGVYVRIPVTKSIMDQLTIVILQHKDSNVKRYREKLLPLVYEATTIEKINSITWDTVVEEAPEEVVLAAA